MRARAVIMSLTAIALLISACATQGTPSPERSTTPATSSSTGPTTSATRPVPVPGAATTEVSVPGTSFGGLVAVRVAKQDGYDRVVFEFANAVPGCQVRYIPLPVRADGSGNEVPMPGAVGAVEVVMRPASAFNQTATPPAPTYPGPPRVSGNTVVVTEAVNAGDFEAVLTWAIGVRQQVPFAVTTLTGPPRLVVDLQQAG